MQLYTHLCEHRCCANGFNQLVTFCHIVRSCFTIWEPWFRIWLPSHEWGSFAEVTKNETSTWWLTLDFTTWVNPFVIDQDDQVDLSTEKPMQEADLARSTEKLNVSVGAGANRPNHGSHFWATRVDDITGSCWCCTWAQLFWTRAGLRIYFWWLVQPALPGFIMFIHYLTSLY